MRQRASSLESSPTQTALIGSHAKVPRSRVIPAPTTTPTVATEINARYLSSIQHNPRWRASGVLDSYVAQPAHPISLRQLVFFGGRNLDEKKIINSANYVRTELPLRIAHRIRDMQKLPYVVVTNRHLSEVYELYYKAFESFRKIPEIKSLEDNEKFCEIVKTALQEHLTVIPRLAMGVLECSDLVPSHELDRFMNVILRSRISRRVIAEQHLALTDTFNSPFHFPDSVSHQPHDFVPEVQIEGRLDTTFPYIPSHLEYIIGELLRNSIQATIDHHTPLSTSLPPIKVLICHTKEHIIFRVSDQGGGIPIAELAHLWSFAKGPRAASYLQNFSRVPKMAATLQELQKTAHTHSRRESMDTSLSRLTSRPPNLRLGMGLPMSRVYAEYWAGSLELHSLDGYGTDVFLQVSKLGNKCERLNLDGV
ncbi:alpha-ketoacid dehydrogenase kinase [Tuber magnatum]|uniref:Protein-serine/threonine kinase n=1 Tax=Tuber magnatum TaxID=42249 RepID=A0A317SE93_9PEZI|nr:alpha-ketoacid dehydrogenase kinase [Tuber magnatum]